MTEMTDSQLAKQMQSLVPSSGEPVELIAGRYEVVQTMSGGMALVHLSRDHQTGQLVALKTFKPEYLSQRNARDLFLREGTMWVDIGRHPHIVRAYRVERIGDGLGVYLVLEWVVQPQGIDKPSLRSWLKPGRPLPMKQALVFALHIVRGMKYATRRIPGLIHRDLKPENVLIGYDGNARVTDFGLASTLSGLIEGGTGIIANKKENMTRTQLTQGAAGTPLYMAPEQWLRQPLDARADIYALGCILYEMVTGQFAAYAETREAVQEIHLTGRIKPPAQTVPREVVIFLRKCMTTQRNQRFRGWEETERALEDVYRWVIGEQPLPERVTEIETREERLAAGHSYNSMGLSYLDIGKLSVAVMYFEQAVGIGRNEHSLALEGPGLGNLGLAHQALGYTERAIDFHEEHLTIARQLGDRAQEGLALGNMGRAYSQLGKVEEAIKYHKRELFIAQELGDSFKVAAALDSLGGAYWRMGDDAQAVENYKQSLTMARQIDDKTRVKSILSSMGHVYLKSGNVKESVALFHQALSLARKIGDRVGEGEAQANLGFLYHSLEYRDRAIEFYERALTIARESNDRRREAMSLSSLGDIYMELGSTAVARDHYELALVAVEEIGDQLREIETLGKLGQAYNTLGDFMHAASLHKRVLWRAKERKWRRVELETLYALGLDYERWGDAGRALEYYQQYLDFAMQGGQDWVAEKLVLSRMSSLYVRVNQFRTAVDTSRLYLERARAADDQMAIWEALNELGTLHRGANKLKEAEEFYTQATAVARALNDAKAEANSLTELGLTQAQEGRNSWTISRTMDRAITRAAESGDNALVAATNLKYAYALCKQKRWAKAIPYAEQAETLYVQLQDGPMLERTRKLLESINDQKDKSTGFF